MNPNLYEYQEDLEGFKIQHIESHVELKHLKKSNGWTREMVEDLIELMAIACNRRKYATV